MWALELPIDNIRPWEIIALVFKKLRNLKKAEGVYTFFNIIILSFVKKGLYKQ